MKHSKYFFLIIAILAFVNSSFSQSLSVDFTGTQELCVNTAANFTNQSVAGDSPIVEYSWDFGDGSGSSDENPTHIYSSPGQYTITLIVQTGNGGADSKVKINYVDVHPNPGANFEISSSGCNIPVDITFTNTTGNGANYKWDFGNGETSTQVNPSAINYSNEGTYVVSLIATSPFGCKDTIEKSIVISDFKAGINAPENVCVGSTVDITDGSTVGANKWDWGLSGGTPTSLVDENFSVKFDTPGNYVITLTSKNTISGCVASTSKSITVSPQPEPSFSNGLTEGCAPVDVTFNNTGSESGASYKWDFGNGQTSTAKNPTTTYTGNGSYTVSLIMTDANGCVDTVSQEAVTLELPDAYFSADFTGGCADLDVQLTDTSESLDPITSWKWDFGNGTTYSGQNPPSQTYPSGTYDITLAIETANGCKDTIKKTDYIEVGEIDDIDFTILETPECVKTDIEFTSSVNIPVPYDESDLVYDWDFGDDGSSSEKDPTYQYATDTGYFDVRLIVDYRGCKDTIIKEDAVYIKAPLAVFDVDNELFCNPSSFPVTLNTEDKAILGETSDDYEMIWKWGDNSSFTHLSKSDLDNAGNGDESHQYNGYGAYEVEQVIYNHTTGCSDSITRTINVSNTVASIDPPSLDSVCVGSPFQMAQSSTSSDSFGTFSWEMGDGSIIDGANPSHMYQSYGDYTIKLTATNSVGCAAIDTYSPFTALALPVAGLGANSLVGCPPFDATITNESFVDGNGMPLSSFEFSFLEAGTTETTTSLNTDVMHTFESVGTYHVTLTATDNYGCVSAPTSIEIEVSKPTALFGIDEIVCEDEDVVTINTSFGDGPLNYEWLVDGNSVFQGKNYTSSYTGNPGTSSTSKEYKLVVTDVNGCTDTLTKDLVISTPIADASFTFSGAATNSNGEFTCPPVFANFVNESEDVGDITDYNWTFSNGKSSILENPSNSYVFPGTYNFSLAITDEFGCVADTTFENFITVLGPTGTPSWEQIPGECNEDVLFHLTDTSHVYSIVWNFDDSHTLNGSLNPTHHYDSHEYFEPTVTLEDDNGCEVIYPMDTLYIEDFGAYADFSVNPTDAELGEEIVLTDESSSTNSTIVNWTWIAENYDPVTDQTGNPYSVYYIESGYYYVTLAIENDHGCVDTVTSKVHVTSEFSMPNVFTPNGDGDNDYFTLRFGIFQSFDIVILNRWGNVIVDKKGVNDKKIWDGRTNRGEMCTDGVYFYKISGVLKDGSLGEEHGFFHLLDGEK